MYIQQQSAELAGQAKDRLGEKFDILTADIDRVQKSGLLDRSLKPGQTAPDFTLPDAFGKQVAMHDLLGAGPVVLSFYRGGWCPFCNI